ncbi:hypothetical protein DLD77_00665 [Chitinophaga alhagiae]|uniref:Polysaccharide biosynthesis protein C-terminal domain-containing protein n=1 Tax=Chitinophaga alhagiae TaxID=2203219 RepID=A0ABM6W8T0_9BACT|nr:hypothetical protein [Chitinophaga alhagiae]AWO00322.1 hypothetical protein DLD77_00665 [Chitinophaga alhagiae]
MRFLLFITRLKCRAFLQNGGADGWMRVLFSLLMLLVVVFYAIGTGYLLNYLGGAQQVLIFGINCTAAAFTLLKGYFPNNTPFRSIFLPVHPLPAWRKMGLQLVYDLLTPFYLLVVIFYLVLLLTADAFTPAALLNSLLYLGMFYLLERILKMQQASRFMPLLTVCSLAIAAGGAYLQWRAMFSIYAPVAGVLLLMVVYSLVYRQAARTSLTGRRLVHGAGVQTVAAAFWAAVIRRKPVRTALVIGVVFKLIFCALILFTLQRNRARFDTDLNVLLAIFCSPLMLCTYLVNNLPGYMPQVFSKTAYLATPGALFKRFLRVYVRFAVPDMLLALGVLLAVETSFRYPLFLLFAYINAAILGFFISVLAPKKVTKGLDFTSFRTNTSIAGNLITGLFIYALFYFSRSPGWFFVIETAFLIIALLVYHFSYKKDYDHLVRSMTAKII